MVVVVCGDGGSCGGSGTTPLFSGWIGIKQMIHASSSGEGGRGGDTDGGPGGIRYACVFDGGMYRVNTTGTEEDTEEADDEEDIGKSVTPIDTPSTIKKIHTKQERSKQKQSTTIANNAFF